MRRAYANQLSGASRTFVVVDTQQTVMGYYRPYPFSINSTPLYFLLDKLTRQQQFAPRIAMTLRPREDGV